MKTIEQRKKGTYKLQSYIIHNYIIIFVFSIKKLIFFILLANIHQIHHCHCRVKIYISQYYTDRFISDLVIGEKVLQKPTEIYIFRKLTEDRQIAETTYLDLESTDL